MRLIRTAAVAATIGVAFAACQSTSAPPEPVPTSLEVSASTANLAALGATVSVSATVKDQDGGTMTGQTVSWASADPGVATASASGASSTITAVANGQTTVTATSGSLSAQVTVTVAQVATQLVKVAGDVQTGAVGDTLAQTLVLELRDARGSAVAAGVGNVAAGATVGFTVQSGGGAVTDATATVGNDGRASTRWVLGTTAGAQSVAAQTTVISGATATFTATATPGPADSLVAVSGDGQTGNMGLPLSDSLVVRVADRFGNLVAGHQVAFSTGSGGSLSPTTVATGSNGRAASAWTLGMSPGAQTAQAQAEAAINGSPVVFGANASPLAVTAVAPDTMVETASVTLTGTGFNVTPANNLVTFDGTPGTVTAASATSLTVTVPAFDCRPVRLVNVQVSVGGTSSSPVAHPLKPAQLLAIGIGQQAVIRDPNQFCLQFAASAAGGDSYLVGVGATAETPAATMPYVMTGVEGAPAPSPAFAMSRSAQVRGPAGGTARVNADDAAWARHWRAEAGLRAAERAILPTLGRPLPDRRARDVTLAATGSQATTDVGDTVRFRVPDISGNPCTDYKEIKTVVQAIGSAGIWHRDIANPTTDSLTTADIQAYSDTFDLHVYARDTLYFGLPSDIDGNGRVEIVLSIEVNKFPVGAAGFVYGGDLFSRASCASSDSSEVFYGHVPDPTNTAGTGGRTKANVLFQMPSLIAHEFTHIIQQSRRIVVLGGSTYMASWESEGQAMLAQEVVGHSVLSNAAGQNYTSTTALQGQGDRWYGQGFDLLAAYYGRLIASKAAGAPELCTLFGSISLSTVCDPFHFYGSSWSFQRYVADRFGGSYPGGEVQLHRDIVSKSPNLQGVANWEAVLGMSLDTLHARWAAMLYGDDRVSGLAPEVRLASWNMFEIFGSYPSDDFRLVPTAQSFTSFAASRSVRGGSTAYTTVSSSGARPALAIRVRDGGDAMLSATMEPVMWVLRLQ